MPSSQLSNPTHAQQLGEVIIAWSRVSDCLERLFIDLANLDNAFVVGVFIEKIRDGQLDDVVSSLAARLEHRPRDAIRTWITSVKGARKQRNEYLHSVYLPMQHADGDEHLYLLGKRTLNRKNGIAEPNLTKLRSANLETLHNELAQIRGSYEGLLRDHFPYAVRQASGAQSSAEGNSTASN